MTFVALFAAVAAVSYLLVGRVRIWALRRNVLDVPTDRSSHATPTPRGGGLAIAVLVTALPLFLAPRSAGTTVVLAGAAVIAIVGWMDDLRDLGAGLRFVVHLAAAAAAIYALGPLRFLWTGVPIPALAGLLLTALWYVGMTNAYNFMDGIDGIAAVQAVAAGTGWAIIGARHQSAFVLLTGLFIAAAACGFLGHNWAPATIFMGDVGSGFLGFVLAALTNVAQHFSRDAVVCGALLVWPFLFESAFTVLRRLSRRENVLAAHRSHLYQRLNIAGWPHATITMVYGGLATLCAAAAVAVDRGGGVGIAAVVAGGVAIFLIVTTRRAESLRSRR